MRTQPVSRRRRRPRLRARTIAVAAAAALAAIAMVVAAARNIGRQDALLQWRRSLEPLSGRVTWPTWDPRWPALPTPRRRNVLTGDLTGPYAFAAREHEVLRSIPCYCGCRRIGHQSNADCYLEDVRPDGMPVWTDHSFSCDICIRITQDVMLLQARGETPANIRRAIEDHYGSVYGNPTPTGSTK